MLIDHLPQELANQLNSYLDRKTRARLEMCSYQTLFLFGRAPIVNRFLPYVLQGLAIGYDRDAEYILKDYPYLALEKGHIACDLSSRTFNIISPLEYVLWTRNTFMFAKMIFFLKESPYGLAALKKQVDHFKLKGVDWIKQYRFGKVTVTGEHHFNYAPLINSLKIYEKIRCSLLSKREKDELIKLWWENVADREVPSNVAMHFCDLKNKFYEKPTFQHFSHNNTHPYLGIGFKTDWFPWVPYDALWQAEKKFGGDIYTYARHYLNLPFCLNDSYSRDAIYRVYGPTDIMPYLDSINRLKEIRMKELDALYRHLISPAYFPMPKHLDPGYTMRDNATLIAKTCRII